MEEKNKHILKQAIAELPQQDPPVDLWMHIEKQLGHMDDLRLSKDSIPSGPKPNLWDKIEEELNENNNEKGRTYLTKSILDLPTSHPSLKNWDSIEQKLPAKSVKIISIKKWTYPLSIAASLVFIFSAYWYLKGEHLREKISVTYSQEFIAPQKLSEQPSIDIASKYSSDEVLQMVEIKCEGVPDACKNPYLIGLVAQYKDLKATQTKLLQDAAKNIDNPHIQKALIRIEKEKTKVAKKVINYLV